MPSLSSPRLAPKGQQMKHHCTAVLPAIMLSVVLLARSCEARRGLPVHGQVPSSSKSRPPGKDDAAATSLKADGWLMTRQIMEATSTVHTPTDDHMAQADAKKVQEGMKTTVSSSAAAVRATPAVRVSQRLSRREDTGFHLDYADPRTHTPSHN